MLLGPHNAKFSQDGNIVALSLDRNGLGCRLLTKKQFIYGRFRVSSKASPGNSAGTVTTLYVSTDVNKQKNEEIDFEFIGNVAGQPYTFHTNLYAPNVGNKEVEFQPWFDPTTSFHIYTISWSSSMVVPNMGWHTQQASPCTTTIASGRPLPSGSHMAVGSGLIGQRRPTIAIASLTSVGATVAEAVQGTARRRSTTN